MNQFSGFKDGININVTTASPGLTKLGDITVNSSTSNLQYYNGSSSSDIATASNTLSFTNKAIDASVNTLSNIVNANIANGAAIAYSKLLLTGSIIGSDISSTASIPYSTLNLTGSILNSDINSAAGIQYSKLALTNSIVNADIASAASIAYAKLSLTNSITNSDISSTASIAYSKLNLAGAVKLTSDVTGLLPIANGGTGQSTANLAFNALAPATAAGGLIVGTGANAYGNLPLGTFGQAITSNGTTTAWTTLQQGNKNYVTFGNAESGNTTGWSLAHTTLSNLVPNQASGSWTSAAGTLSLGVVTSGQLAGTTSYSLTSSAATTAGDMFISQPYTIDLEDQAKPLTDKFYYSVISGLANLNLSGTSANTFQVYIYDVTNSQWIQPAGAYGLTQGVGVGYNTSTWQTPSNMTQFRIAVVCVNASAGACTLYLDDFSVGPQTAPLGAVVTDWVSCTPVLTGFTSITGLTAQSRRVGASLEMFGTFTPGVTNGSQARIALCYNGASGNVTSAVSALQNVGTWTYAAAGPVFGSILVGAGVTYLTMSASATGLGGLTEQTGTNLGGGTTYSFYASVPIVGWSSNVQMSSDTDTRVISWNGSQSSQAVTANVTDIAFTTINDRSGSWTGTQFKVPVSGDYIISGSGACSVMAATLQVYVNGTAYNNGFFSSAAGVGYVSSGCILITNAPAGALISLRSNASVTVTSGAIGIFRLSGPSVIAATESVNALYTNGTGSLSSTLSLVTYTTKVSDSHNAYNTSTGVYTIPVSGKYSISGAQGMVATSLAAELELDIYKNSIQLHQGYSYSYDAQFGQAQINVQAIPLLAGDEIQILGASVTGVAPTYANNSTQDWFSITRVGN